MLLANNRCELVLHLYFIIVIIHQHHFVVSQELIEKETTQSEVLHMECKETGQFAHRETTQYEQLETFNAEVVAETKGAEEYVHLKSLEDEYHYMESTMPNKEAGGEGGEGTERGGDAAYGEPVDNEAHRAQYYPGEGEGEGGEVSAEEAAAAQAAMEAEYAEAYHLYHQKQREQREQRERGGGGADDEEDPAVREMFAMSPRAPPPPFSDDAHQAQGFSAGLGKSLPERDRAMDAFAFAEEEDLREEEQHHQQLEGQGGEGEADEAEQSQLFGEKIGTPPPPKHSSGRPPVQASGTRDKSYLFDPDPAIAPIASLAATEATAASAGEHQRDNYFSRTSSYESLHEID